MLSVGLFGTAILLATFGVLDLAVALAGAVTLLVALKVVPLRELYESVEWPVVVLLGSLIPIGDYWRMGLPIEILVIAVGVPAILWVWPM
jgi:di/tricarboxylate transporter